MRTCQSAKSRRLLGSLSAPNASRPFISRFQPIPPPMKKPLLCCHVRPALAVVRLLIGEVAGAIVSMVRMRGPVNVSVSEFGTLPVSSKIPRSGLRDGNPTPAPQRNAPLAESTSSGSPRNS